MEMLGFWPLILLLYAAPLMGLSACSPLLAGEEACWRDFLWGGSVGDFLLGGMRNSVTNGCGCWAVGILPAAAGGCLRRPLPGEGKRSALDREGSDGLFS